MVSRILPVPSQHPTGPVPVQMQRPVGFGTEKLQSVALGELVDFFALVPLQAVCRDVVVRAEVPKSFGTNASLQGPRESEGANGPRRCLRRETLATGERSCYHLCRALAVLARRPRWQKLGQGRR